MSDKSIVISSRIRLARNLENTPFPSMLDEKKANEVKSIISSSILESNSYISKDFNLIDIDKMKEYEKLSLVEKHLISKEMLEGKGSSVLLNNDETVSIMINEEDHIRLQVINRGFDIEKSFDIANKLDDLMEEKLNYAFDSKIGYLTSCLTNIGCGLRASVMMHLPILNKTNKIARLSHNLSKYGMTIRGLYGEGTQGVGNMFQVSNQVSLGLSEEEILNGINIVVGEIIKSELEERENLIKKGKEEFEDVVFRSLGTLKYGKIISSLEAFNLLSNVRCGKEMGIINTIDVSEIQDITETVQSGNIQRILSKNMTSRERDIERAKMLNKVFN